MDNLLPERNTPVSTKQRIIETAIELFSQHGYSGVSIREITRSVGIKESALYNHYRTKDEMLETIYSMFRKEQELYSLPPVELLSVILDNTSIEQFLMQGFDRFKETMNHPLLMRIWRILNIEQYRDARAREIILEEIYKRTIDFLEAAFQILVEKQQIKPLPPRMLAYEYQYPIFTVMTEYLLLKFDDKDTDELEQRVHEHISYFIENIKI